MNKLTKAGDDRMIAVNRVSMRQTVIIQAVAHLFTIVYSYSIFLVYATSRGRTKCARPSSIGGKAAHEGTESGVVQLN